MLTIQSIIDEADLLVPNTVSVADKLTQLNAINGDFFNVVKIPKLARFSGMTSQPDYTLPADVREKNIDLVEVGLLKYLDLMSDNVNPTQNNWSYDDSNNKITLSPAPYKNGLPGIVRYHRIATSTYTTGNLSVHPDAPSEYHWTYVLALSSWLAITMDDPSKFSIFDAQYKAAWNVAAQHYTRE